MYCVCVCVPIVRCYCVFLALLFWIGETIAWLDGCLCFISLLKQILVFTEMVLDDVFRLFIKYMYLFCFIIFSGPGVIEADENCMKFLKRTLPCAFEKVHTCTCV